MLIAAAVQLSVSIELAAPYSVVLSDIPHPVMLLQLHICLLKQPSWKALHISTYKTIKGPDLEIRMLLKQYDDPLSCMQPAASKLQVQV